MTPNAMPGTIFTIGHSNRSWERFVGLLQLNEVAILIDIRRYPGSRAQPQFSKESFEKNLKKEGIEYLHMESLGGRRKPNGSDANAAWENEQFRGYADHMESAEFRGGVEQVLGMHGNIALMCAEAVPWRCHRQLLADHITAQGREVRHIIDEQPPKLHRMTAFAKAEGGKVTYPSPQRTLPT